MTTKKKKICIVGGGAAGLGTLWALSQYGEELDLLLLHNDEVLGGHSHTVDIKVKHNKTGEEKLFPVDDGTLGRTIQHRGL